MKKEILLPLLMGSDKDLPYAQSIKKLFDGANSSLVNINIIVDIRIASVHKCCEYFIKAVQEYEKNDNVLCYIGVAGKSNALSGVVAANSKFPTIASPYFKDSTDLLININSSLQCPAYVPVMTILDPINVVESIIRIL